MDEEQKIIDFVKENKEKKIIFLSPYDGSLNEIQGIHSLRSTFDEDDERWEPGFCIDFKNGQYCNINSVELKDLWIMTNSMDIVGE